MRLREPWTVGENVIGERKTQCSAEIRHTPRGLEDMRSWQTLETNYRQETLGVGKVRTIEVGPGIFGLGRKSGDMNSQFASSVIGGNMIGGGHARSRLGREMRK
jgi:hypothetical protein